MPYTWGEEVKDPGLVCVAVCITIVYTVHQITVGGDGAIIATVLCALGAVAGVKVGALREQSRARCQIAEEASESQEL